MEIYEKKFKDFIKEETLDKETFVKTLLEVLRNVSPGAQKRILEDMTRLETSILCKEYGVCDLTKEKPIKRYGTPVREWMLKELSNTIDNPTVDDINWAITKGVKKDYNEIRRAVKHIMEFSAAYYSKTKDRKFMDTFFNALKSNQDGLIKSTAPIKFKSLLPGKKLNVGKRKEGSKNTKDAGYTKEHLIPTAVIYDAMKDSVFNNNVNDSFDIIMKDNFQVLLNSDDDDSINKAGFRDKMPNGWKFGDDPWERYKASGIDLSTIIPI